MKVELVKSIKEDYTDANTKLAWDNAQKEVMVECNCFSILYFMFFGTIQMYVSK